MRQFWFWCRKISNFVVNILRLWSKPLTLNNSSDDQLWNQTIFHLEIHVVNHTFMLWILSQILQNRLPWTAAFKTLFSFLTSFVHCVCCVLISHTCVYLVLRANSYCWHYRSRFYDSTAIAAAAETRQVVSTRGC